MLRFISFGSGSSGNCYYLFTDNDGLMIDVGVGLRTLKKHFTQYGLNMHDIHHVLVTHDHADHVKSVGSLSKTFGLPVYATRKVHNGIDINYCVKQKVPAERVRVIEKTVTFSIGDFVVTPFNVPHDSLDNVGYKIVCDGVTFCLMTDIGHVTDEMKQFIKEANYLVIEANHDEQMLAAGPYPQYLKQRIASSTGHLSNRGCGEAIGENASENLRYVWACHLSAENNHPVLAHKTIEEVLARYGMKSGVDFGFEVLKRRVPTGIFDLK